MTIPKFGCKSSYPATTVIPYEASTPCHFHRFSNSSMGIKFNPSNRGGLPACWRFRVHLHIALQTDLVSSCSLEVFYIVFDYHGSIWRTNERRGVKLLISPLPHPPTTYYKKSQSNWWWSDNQYRYAD
ncbi:hypothetical protein PIB30_047725 [Stylosanthes scabra]|uniref:Uncharacterized protein n=1 Tax=Stylosanthes scabra TaxID=79078 RepID=A0ABU6VF58_9FABA|nr:hypothetical protein [Stylosanthes scabra]